SYPRGATVAGGDHDPDAPVQNEMHGIGGVTSVDDDVADVDLEAFAAMNQSHGVTLGAEDLLEPVAQVGLFALAILVLRNDFVLAPLQCVIQFRHDADFMGNESARPQG